MRLSLSLLFFIAPLVTTEVAGSPVQAERALPTCFTLPKVSRGSVQVNCEW